MRPVFHDLEGPHAGLPQLRVGLDLVQISRIRESLERFGDRFMRRLFSDDEISYALQGDSQSAERLAARFAAKEAAIKAFALGEVGVGWREIEVRKLPGGACRLMLHGTAASKAAELGVREISLSLSHDGDYAGAVVTALCAPGAADSSLS
jgi:holo-[acyl-carrier protein] synthase